MNEIEFSKDEKEVIVKKVQMYFREELDMDLGQFDAQFLLDFFSKEVGCLFYNRGLYDAKAIIEERMETAAEAVYELEKFSNLR